MVEPDDREPYEEEAPRSIFSAMWFRALIVILVFGVIAAVAVPHILDMLSPPPTKQAAKQTPPSPPPTPPVAPAPPAPTTPPPTPPPTTAKPATPPATGTAASAQQKAPTPAAKPEAVAKTETPPKKPDAATAKAVASKSATSKAPAKAPAARGPYWVQVGAFKDAEAAKRLATKLRAQNYPVEESTTPGSGSAAAAKPAPSPAAPTGADRYNVFVSGMAPAEINATLSAKGLAAESVAGGVVVKPSLPLREAVALSKDLAVDGMKVQVRRATDGTAATGAPAAAPAAGAAESLHRVRVGGYPDRTAAVAAARELEGKGYKPFIARGSQ